MLSYQKAQDLASQLSHADPIRLSLLLNLSVYMFEISDGTQDRQAVKEAREEAINMAKDGIQKAEEELDMLDNQKASESAFILQFLRENLNMWRNKLKKVGSSKKNLFSQ